MKLHKAVKKAEAEQESRYSKGDCAKISTESWGGHQALQIKRILVPVDFSDPSKKTLQYALSVAREFGSELILLHVVQPYPILADLPAATPELTTILKDDATANLQKLVNTVKGVAVKQIVRLGNPAREIAAEAEAQRADLIIISTHGRTGLSHLLIGSVAEHVVRFAKCPVLTLREREHDFVKVAVDDAQLNRVGTQTLST